MTSLGIDKISITCKPDEFIIRSNHLLFVQNLAYQPNSPDRKEDPILFNDLRAQKAYRNTEKFNISISEKGLLLGFNPSKISHPYNLTNDNYLIQEIFNNCRSELKDLGVILPPDIELKMNRLDMARNNQMNLPAHFYAPIFQSLSGVRMEKKTVQDSHYFENMQREVVFYDKTEEVTKKSKGKIKIDERIMRSESRALKRASIKSVYKFESFGQMIIEGSEYRELKYKKNLIYQVFSKKSEGQQMQIFALDIDKIIAQHSAYREKYGNGCFDKLIADIDIDGHSGLEGFVIGIGGIENLKYVLSNMGYAKSQVYDKYREIKERMQFSSFFQSQDRNQNFSNLYNEIYTKFAS